MRSEGIGRRSLLRGAGASAAILLGGLDLSRHGASFARLAAADQLKSPSPEGSKQTAAPAAMGFVPETEIAIRSVEKTLQILSGAPTKVMSYEGRLVSGTGATVDSIPGSYLGPIIRAKKGTKLRITYTNDLGEVSVIHPHGMHVPEDCDGQPMQAIAKGATKYYDFPVIDRAGPYWFHPHPMMTTAHQVAMGLAGLFYVTDEAEALAVPGAATGANDVPVVIQDRSFDSNNQFLYQPNQMWGYLGDRILVNGKPNATLSLEPRSYRLRVLNGSNARTYKLGWSNGMPLKVIGTDGGLLPAVVSRSYAMLMPGERIDLWVDFASAAGKQLILKSLSFSAGSMGGGGMGGGGAGGGGMGGMGGGMTTSLANGAAFNILTVNVGRKASAKPVLGSLLPLEESFDAERVYNFANPVGFTLDKQMMVWTINGRVYEDMIAVPDEMVYVDKPIAWEWINNSPIPHPMHIHNVQFQVLSRASPGTSSYTTVNQGFVDSGWKDTVLVWPGERVKIGMRFWPMMPDGPNLSGMYMYHCHILEHEDMGMMRNLMVMDPMTGM